MSFVRQRGKVKTIWLAKKASTAFSQGDLVAVSESGADSDVIIPATASTAATQHVGVINRAVASTDDDYADKAEVPVLVPLEKNVEWKVSTNSTAEDGMRGNEVDLTDAGTVNEAASAIKAVKIREVLDTSTVTVVIKQDGNY